MLKNNRSRIELIVKWLIALASVVYIYYYIHSYANVSTVISFTVSEWKNNLPLLLTVFFLMFANWSIEALKWQLLASHLEKISWLASLQSVLSGVTSGIFTPNRVGEFAGRIFAISVHNRTRGVALSFLGSFSQLLVTLIAGIIAVFLLLNNLVNLSGVYSPIILSTKWIMAFIVLFLLVLYFKADLFKEILSRLPLLKRWATYFEVYKEVSSTRLLKIFSLSLLRYFIFTVQFYFLLQFMQVQIPFFMGVKLIALTFFIVTAIPTYTVSEIAVRSSVATYIIGMYTDNGIGVMGATFLLWIINVTIPALIGVFLLFRAKKA